MERELKAAVADLHRMSPLPGLLRSLPVIPIVVALVAMTLATDDPWAFTALGLASGLVWASFLVLTHDALHHTLTGIPWFDEIFPRVISYPALWFHGLYSELHTLHHKMNGNDLDDPERVQFTEKEYNEASALGRWRIRNQWWVNLFILGGFGLIYDHVKKGLRLGERFPRIRRQLALDIAGIVVMNGLLYTWAAMYGMAGKAICLFLLLERAVGAVHQFRSHILHYGLWGKERSPLMTQIMSSRNITTSAFTSRYFNHLNYHSVHHAFPRIPFFALEEAHERLTRICERHGIRLVQDDSYARTGLECARNPVLIRA